MRSPIDTYMHRRKMEAPRRRHKWRPRLTLLAMAVLPFETAAFSRLTAGSRDPLGGISPRFQLVLHVAAGGPPEVRSPTTDRPLLRKFGQGIDERIRNSKEGSNRFGLENHYTSEETIPCLNMQTSTSGSGSLHDDDDYNNNNNNKELSSKSAIREAYTADDQNKDGGMHGRSSGSGCSIIRLSGKDAESVRGLVSFANHFFEGVDDDERNDKIKEVGVFRIDNNVHAGFDQNVDLEGKMQVLYSKLIPGETSDEDPLMLPLEVGELVGAKSLGHAHRGMSTLFDIGSQITSAVLGMDSLSANKLLDDCTQRSDCQQQRSDLPSADDVSNSYQRLIRYLKPQQISENGETDAAFWPHADSTFLTLIPMTEIPGLEVWCPSSQNAENCDLTERGEWVRPIKPSSAGNEGRTGNGHDKDNCVYVVALAGEFLQLLSDGQIPTCIHRVVVPGPSLPGKTGFTPTETYKPRISAPLFLRPRRGEEAFLDVRYDLNTLEQESKGLYFEEGLLEECDLMRVWDYMECMSPTN